MNRDKDALAIQIGACNPSGIAHSIIDACREMREQGKGTADICRDPALRLMVHQLAYITNAFEVENSMTVYSELSTFCTKQAEQWPGENGRTGFDND